MTDSRASSSTALATRVVTGELVTADALNTQVAAWRSEGFNVLMPGMSLSSIPKFHKIGYSPVLINPDPAAKEVYQDNLFARGNDVALTKVGLEKIAQCAGISLDRIDRLDSGHVPNFYEYRVYGHWFSFDGMRLDRTASKAYDLKDGSLQTQGWSAARLNMARTHAQAGAESRAINRLYRQYGIRHVYTKAELARPFIVMKLLFDPDLNDPRIAEIFMRIKLGADAAMNYPASNGPAIERGQVINPLLLPLNERPASAVVDVSGDDVDDIPAGRPIDEEPASAASEPRDPGVLVLAVLTDGFGGFNVDVENGKRLHTADKPLALRINAAKKEGTRLRFEVETRNGLLEIVEFSPVSPY